MNRNDPRYFSEFVASKRADRARHWSNEAAYNRDMAANYAEGSSSYRFFMERAKEADRMAAENAGVSPGMAEVD